MILLLSWVLSGNDTEIRKEYLEIPWASLRAMVEPSFAERSVIKHREYLSNARLITSRAINITDKEVVTAEGRSLDYDYLVISTGHLYSVPITRTERLSQYEEGKFISPSSCTTFMLLLVLKNNLVILQLQKMKR